MKMYMGFYALLDRYALNTYSSEKCFEQDSVEKNETRVLYFYFSP
jgi:hypothetical protein